MPGFALRLFPSVVNACASASALRNGGLGRGVAIYGCVIAPLIILGIVTGYLRLNVHGMAIVVLGHAIWFVVVGAQLCSRQASEATPLEPLAPAK